MTLGYPSRLVIWAGLPAPSAMIAAAKAAALCKVKIAVWKEHAKTSIEALGIAEATSLLLERECERFVEFIDVDMQPGDAWFGAIPLGCASTDNPHRRGVRVYDATELPLLLRHLDPGRPYLHHTGIA